jgi:hypothetical protein
MRVRFLRLVAIALALLPAIAGAWGPVGHQAVGALADQLVHPATQAAIAELLAADLDRNGQPSGRHSLADVADWADEIRGEDGDHPRWHFDNTPVCQGEHPARTWCADGACATHQIHMQLAILADRSRPLAERNQALKWVVHLAGDLHQPLHAADLAEGGNLIHVAPHARPRHRGDEDDAPAPERSGRSHHGHGESLHAFWDTHLVVLALHPSRNQIPARSMQRLLREAQAEEPALLAKDPDAWAAESNEIARHFALNLDGIGCDPAQSRQFPVVALSDAYVAQGRHIVEQRIALAGARLAYVLDQALDRKP